MADSNHLGARAEDLSDDDPFAELTRIMGQGSVVRPRAVDDAAQSFNLDLDLEKELLGDLSADSKPASGFEHNEEPHLNVAEAFGDNTSGDDLFNGSALDELERALAADPLFAREEQPGYGAEPSSQDLASTLDSVLSDARWNLSSTSQEPLFGDPLFSTKSGDDPSGFAPEAEARDTAASSVADDPFDLAGSIFNPGRDANVLSPRVDDFFDEDYQTSRQEPLRTEPSFDRLFDNIDLHDEHAQSPGEADAFGAPVASPFGEEPHDRAPSADESVQPAARSFEEELADALKFGDWTRVENNAAPATEAVWQEPEFPQPEAQQQEPEWMEPGAAESSWTDELSDAFAAEQAAETDTSWMDSQENWSQPATGHDWTVDPATLRNAETNEAGAPYSYADLEQSPEQDSVQDEQAWAQQDEQYHWGGDSVEATGYDGAPEIETVEIPEKAVAVTEDLDLPEVPYHEEVKPAAQLDDIEELLSGAFGSLDQSGHDDKDWNKPESGQTAQAADDSDFEDFFTADLAAASAAALARNGYGQATAPQLADDWDSPLGYEQAPRPMPGTPPPAPTNEGLFSRRSVQIAALLAGVAILGIGGVAAYNFMGGSDGETVVIKADNSPIKEKPENPGGATIPNQDSQVYRQVAGETGNAAGQSQLISGAEEPVELPSPNDNDEDDIGDMLAEEEAEGFAEELAASEQPAEADTTENAAVAKNEERLVASDQQEQAGSPGFATLTPRRVRSFIVRPDGTMVPREIEAPAAANAQPLPGVPNDRIEVAAARPAQQDEGLVAGQEIPPLSGAGAQASDAAGPDQVTVPRSAPIPAPRPASAPRTAAAQAPTTAAQAPAQQEPAAPTRVAAAQPQQSPAASGWSVQIASQPTLEAAQQSYQSMAQRYGSMLQGKGVNIVKAEVPGKGTYYRVRIPAGSKNEAIALCERLKSQGGTCFVSQ